MRRPAPRPLERALEVALGEAQPPGLLAAVQHAWQPVVGPALSGAATPASEHGGTVTVACEAGVWAQELELLAPDLVERLNGHLAAAGEPARVERLRFVVGSAANRR